ncbi:putative LRR receptor-like serine/threonine-protein kinase [Acorus calamus]|uniref:non-specific serine/threonine protein kinase n=1 Tax=Acorus calamus TaxID=4465 RepID=A0AAV9CPV7_ACOCL|nr:putative LRR receptor-like serine/threonine-protein kinase [Acorus calamus]
MQALQSHIVLKGTIFFLFILCVSATPKPKNHPRDLSALLAFKSHVTSDPHNILTTTWNPNTSFCTWTGVYCSRRRPRVTALQLESYSLAGTIAPEIGNLSFLALLDLSENAFTGHIPNSLGSLRRLKLLALLNNTLDGPIPESIFNMSSLESVLLYRNSLSGEIPAVRLPRLRALALFYNRLDGPIPPTIFNIPTLEKLSLAGNSLTGEIPPIHLPRLNFLDLSNNQLSGEIPGGLGDSVSLTVVNLYENRLTGPIPSSIGNLSQLSVLDLSYNNLTGDVIPASLGRLSSLHTLILRQNDFRPGPMPRAILNMSSLVVIDLTWLRISGSFPTDFGLHFPFLEEIHIPENGFTGPIPSSLSNASNLMVLEISGNMFTGSVPAPIGELPLLQKLNLADNQLGGGLGFLSSLLNSNNFEEILLSGNSFNGPLPDLHLNNISTSLQLMLASSCSITGSISMFSNLSNMIHLDLSYNELTGTIPLEFKNLEKIQELHLTGNRLEGSIPQEIFQSMTNLGILFLDQNMLSGPIPSHVGNLTSLQTISFAENALSSTIPSGVWGLKQLISLDFSQNFLEGYLSEEVGNLNFLTVMDLSSNRLSGFLPITLGHLQMLVNLNLQNNSFSGPIPQSISGLISLSLLDLSSNSLSGKIPNSLANLQDLTFLNLSFNRLEGEVPNGGAFANLTVQSLIGNLALCGATKQGLPTCKASDTKTSRTRPIMLKYVLPFLLFGLAVFVIVFYVLLNKKCKRRGHNLIDRLPSLVHQRFVSERELVRATDNFNEANILGVGSFGSVYKGRLEDGMIVAIKVLKLGSSEQASKRFEKECEVMRNVRHRNLVKIISSCSTENFKALILQYMPNKSLDKWLHSSQDHMLSILERVCIASDVALALEYLHHGCSRPVVHSDVKPSNILLDEDMVAHLGDFGISKLLCKENKSATPTSTLGTLGYVAPEYGLSGKSSIRGDIYSFGILLLETFTRTKPTDVMFSGGSSMRQWVEDSFPGEY